MHFLNAELGNTYCLLEDAVCPDWDYVTFSSYRRQCRQVCNAIPNSMCSGYVYKRGVCTIKEQHCFKLIISKPGSNLYYKKGERKREKYNLCRFRMVWSFSSCHHVHQPSCIPFDPSPPRYLFHCTCTFQASRTGLGSCLNPEIESKHLR